MKYKYIKKFSPTTPYEEIKYFEIDILGDPQNLQEKDDIDIKYYSEDSCKVVEIVITKRSLN